MTVRPTTLRDNVTSLPNMDLSSHTNLINLFCRGALDWQLGWFADPIYKGSNLPLELSIQRVVLHIIGGAENQFLRVYLCLWRGAYPATMRERCKDRLPEFDDKA